MGVDRAIDITAKQRKIVTDLLERHLPNTTTWVYGSRAKWASRPQSDLDLVVFATPEQNGRVSDLREALEESNLPFRVDLFVWDAVPEQFRKHIKRDHVALVEKVELGTAGDRWVSRCLGEVVDFLAGFPFKSDGYVNHPKAPRLLRGDNIAQGTLRWDGAKRWPYEATDSLTPYWLREGDVVIAMDRPWIEAGLKFSSVRETDLPALLVQRVARLRGSDHLDTRFLNYVIGSRDFTEYVLSVQTGTAVPHISARQIKEFEFSLPPLPEQRVIAHILGTLDDKIGLNRRMNETLEAMARALFKSWFVDFDPVRAKIAGRDTGLPPHLADLFPDRLVDSELGKIPEGWEWATFGDVVEQLRENENPLASPDSIFRHFSIPAFDASQSPKAEFGQNIKSQKSHVPSGVVLLSKLNPEIERVWFVDVQPDERAVCSTEFLVLRPRPPYGQPYAYCLARSPAFRQELEGLVTGTSKSHQRAQVAAILSLNVVKPADALATSFERAARPLLQRTLECRRESCTLAETRDTLLPKLVSGELAVERMQSGSSERPNHDDSPASFRQYGTNRRKLKTAQ